MQQKETEKLLEKTATDKCKEFFFQSPPTVPEKYRFSCFVYHQWQQLQPVDL